VTGPNLRSTLGSWLILALGFAVVAHIVWGLVAPLIVPAAVLLVVGFGLVTLLRWWKRKNFW
jgi:uncharacterized membrane protein